MSDQTIVQLMHQANDSYLKAEEFSRQEDYESAQSHYQKASQIYLKMQKEDMKDLESLESMRIIAESCMRKVKIITIREKLLPKIVG